MKKIISLMLIFTVMSGIIPHAVCSAEAPALSKKKATIYVGKNLTLKIKNKPLKYKNKNVFWKSSNSKICKITKKAKTGARIKAIAPGKATITASKGSMKLKCKINVKEKKVQVFPAFSSIIPLSSSSLLLGFYECTPLENGVYIAKGNANTNTYPTDMGAHGLTHTYASYYTVNLLTPLMEGDELLIGANTDKGPIFTTFRYQTGVYQYTDNEAYTSSVGTETIYEYNLCDKYSGKLAHINSISISGLPEGMGYTTINFTQDDRNWIKILFTGIPVSAGIFNTTISGNDELGNSYTSNITWTINEGEVPADNTENDTDIPSSTVSPDVSPVPSNDTDIP